MFGKYLLRKDFSSFTPFYTFRSKVHDTNTSHKSSVITHSRCLPAIVGNLLVQVDYGVGQTLPLITLIHWITIPIIFITTKNSMVVVLARLQHHCHQKKEEEGPQVQKDEMEFHRRALLSHPKVGEKVKKRKYDRVYSLGHVKARVDLKGVYRRMCMDNMDTKTPP